jgi:hypothetical protein
MSASATQKLKTPLILGMALADIEAALDALSVEKQALLDEAIAKYDGLRFRGAKVKTDGIELDPEDERQFVRQYVASLLEIASPHGGFIGTV